MFHSPQSNTDDHSLIYFPHPVRKFSGFLLHRFFIPILVIVSFGLKQSLSAQETNMRSERINLYAVPTFIAILDDIQEYGKTWSQVREITLKRVEVQPQDKPSLSAANKRIEKMQVSRPKLNAIS